MDNSDEYNLQRFLVAQEVVYDTAYRELASGRKTGHWMWFIFPQLKGLGASSVSQYYGISSPAEASAYIEHKLLGSRLMQCTELVVRVHFRSIERILGSVDALKFHSCMTLFAIVAPGNTVFEKALAKYFNGMLDPRTVEMCAEWTRVTVR